MVESLKAKQSLKAAELQDGDIVCFQRTADRRTGTPNFLEKRLGGDAKAGDVGYVATPQHSSLPQLTRSRARKSDRFEDAKEYYDFQVNKKLVKFHPHFTRCDANEYPPFELVLNSKIGYDILADKVGAHLGVDGTHLRLYTVNGATGNPRGAVKRGPGATLYSILYPTGYGTLNMNQRNDVLFFEVLDMSLAELDTKKNVKITYLSEGITKEVGDSAMYYLRCKLTVARRMGTTFS